MNKTTVGFLAKCSLLFSVVLLLSNLPSTPTWAHAWLGSLPLALAGIAYATLQLRLKPGLRTLFRRLLLAATFLLWAVDQVLPPGRIAMLIGDLVVSAYVLDLYWMIQEQEAAPLADRRQ
jgi:hypothetical protein